MHTSIKNTLALCFYIKWDEVTESYYHRPKAASCNVWNKNILGLLTQTYWVPADETSCYSEAPRICRTVLGFEHIWKQRAQLVLQSWYDNGVWCEHPRLEPLGFGMRNEWFQWTSPSVGNKDTRYPTELELCHHNGNCPRAEKIF